MALRVASAWRVAVRVVMSHLCRRCHDYDTRQADVKGLIAGSMRLWSNARPPSLSSTRPGSDRVVAADLGRTDGYGLNFVRGSPWAIQEVRTFDELDDPGVAVDRHTLSVFEDVGGVAGPDHG